MEAVLDLDHELEALLAVGEVDDVGDALELLGLDEHLDPLDDALGAHAVGQLGHDDPLASGAHRVDPGAGPHPEAAAAGLVGVADALEADDLAARGQVRPRDEPHQVVDGGRRVVDQVAQRLDHLDQVVRGHVGGHADRDPGGAVDQQVGDRRGQHRRLGLAAVVVGLEVDRVLVDRGGHRHRRGPHPALGVAHRGGRVVGGAEVAVAVDHREPHRPRLGHPDQGVVDRAVAVGVQATHHLTDDAGALDVAAVGSQAHVGHRVEDPSLNRLEPVARVGQRPGVDDGVGVLQEAGAHLVAHVDVDDVFLEVLGRCGGTTCHAAHSPSRDRRSCGGTPLSPTTGTFPDVTAPSEQPTYPAHWEADVLLRDGHTAHLRPIRSDDKELLVSFYDRVSDESKYLRFFAPMPTAVRARRRPVQHRRPPRTGRVRAHGGGPDDRGRTLRHRVPGRGRGGVPGRGPAPGARHRASSSSSTSRRPAARTASTGSWPRCCPRTSR